jgi:hypothetical protein
MMESAAVYRGSQRNPLGSDGSGYRSGDTIAIFGPGQRGLGCVIGAHRAVRRIVVIGLASDHIASKSLAT